MADDPLRLLIKTITSNGTIRKLSNDTEDAAAEVQSWQDCRFIALANQRFAKDTLTRYKKDDTNKHDLQSLLACYEERNQAFPGYLQFCMASSIPFISAVDREKVVQVLSGQRQESEEEQIEPLQDETIAVSSSKRGADAVATGASAGRPAKRAKYVVNKEDQELVKKLLTKHDPKQLTDSTKILRGSKPTNFDYIRQLVADRIKTAKDDLKKFDPKHQHAQQQQLQQQAAASGRPGGKKRPLNPIIVVSPSSSAMITMHNVKPFLEEAVFETSSSRISQGLKSMNDLIAVYHKRQIGSNTATSGGLGSASSRAESGAGAGLGEKLVKYSVVDSVEALAKFGEDAWDRVVCVMTTGQEWQFRPYKWSEPKELFHHGLSACF